MSHSIGFAKNKTKVEDGWSTFTDYSPLDPIRHKRKRDTCLLSDKEYKKMKIPGTRKQIKISLQSAKDDDEILTGSLSPKKLKKNFVQDEESPQKQQKRSFSM